MIAALSPSRLEKIVSKSVRSVEALVKLVLQSHIFRRATVPVEGRHQLSNWISDSDDDPPRCYSFHRRHRTEVNFAAKARFAGVRSCEDIRPTLSPTIKPYVLVKVTAHVLQH